MLPISLWLLPPAEPNQHPQAGKRVTSQPPGAEKQGAERRGLDQGQAQADSRHLHRVFLSPAATFAWRPDTASRTELGAGHFLFL